MDGGFESVHHVQWTTHFPCSMRKRERIFITHERLETSVIVGGGEGKMVWPTIALNVKSAASKSR